MTSAGYDSRTFMTGYYAINKRADFDLYIEDALPPLRKLAPLFKLMKYYVAFIFSIRYFDVFHMPFSGGFLGFTPLAGLEPFFLKLAKKRTVVIGYGADFYAYSHIIDPSLRHALLASYPEAAKQERRVRSAVERWCRYADAVIASTMLDGLGRWDVLTVNPFVIDTEAWTPKTQYSDADGTQGVVVVIHAPNHREFKGTEFLIDAIKTLQKDGLRVELVLMEKTPNEEIRRAMTERADILVEQLIYTGYALTAIEGMACGLPVLANLENGTYTRVVRRYAYLDECPVVSTAPETLAITLRALVTNPILRRQIGEAGRQYVLKYHSYKTAQYLFGAIYRKILEHDAVDLINLFHPIKSSYNRSTPHVWHPLVESHLPPEYNRSC